MSEVTVTAANFESEVKNSDIPVLIDFWASWCGPCRLLSPLVAEIAEEYDGKLKVCKVNVDEEPALANAFNVDSIPFVALISGGKVLGTSIGYVPKEKLVELVSKAV